MADLFWKNAIDAKLQHSYSSEREREREREREGKLLLRRRRFMAALTSLLSSSRLLPLSSPSQRLRPPISTALCGLRLLRNPRKVRPLVLASSSPFDDLNFKEKRPSDSSPKKSVLLNLVQEIEPLDVTIIQKDVPATTLDAMKRTISGMLGLLPSAQFQVLIEALWDPLSKLLVSSMMTGYTLRNAEFRLCLERNLDIYDRNIEKQKLENIELDGQMLLQDSAKMTEITGKNELSSEFRKLQDNPCETVGIQGLGQMTPEAQQYILHLQSHLSSVKKELSEVQRKNAALQMQQFVGEEKNELLDYLRSLQPEKVAELSEPTSPELKETIHSVIHGLLATLSPKMHSKAPSLENSSTATINVGNEDFAEPFENAPLQFQPLVSLTRDYLARLLFWCMLLGHYLRGLEYRMELSELLSLSTDPEHEACDGERLA